MFPTDRSTSRQHPESARSRPRVIGLISLVVIALTLGGLGIAVSLRRTGNTQLAPSASSAPISSATPASSATVSPPPSETVQVSPTTTVSPLAGRVIVIDPGHNGRNYAHPEIINRKVDVINRSKACDTTGTETNSGYAEHAFNWDLAERLAAVLRAQGAQVILTRTDDAGVGPCITERAAIGNQAEADLAISLHADGAASSGHGFHIIMPGSVGLNADIVQPSARFGKVLRDAFRDGTAQPYANYIAQDGLATRTDLGGLNLSTVPKVFLECGNMRNSADARQFLDPQWRQRAAVAIATGMATYLTPT